MKDDSGSYAVFTEQGSSASQMTAAKVTDIISRLPGCNGQAADAIYAYTPCQNERCTDFTENSKVRMSRYLDTSTQAQTAKLMVQYGRPSRSSSPKFVRSSFGKTMMGKADRENSITTRLGKVSNRECLFENREKRIFLSVYVDDLKIGWNETEHESNVDNTLEER